jgi:hypothetical protein
MLGRSERSSRLNETGMNHDTRPFLLLLDDSVELLNAEMNYKQLTQRTYLLRLKRPPRIESSEIEE